MKELKLVSFSSSAPIKQVKNYIYWKNGNYAYRKATHIPKPFGDLFIVRETSERFASYLRKRFG